MTKGIVSENKVVPIKKPEDIPSAYRGTPIELLLRYQNFDEPHAKFQQAQMLIGMCIDYRKHLNIPENFAYMVRTGGANLTRNEFKVSFAVAVGGVKTVALIGHTNCGMVDLASKKDAFVQGLVDNAGWTRAAAEAHFLHDAPQHEIVDAADFVKSQCVHLRAKYPKVLFAPMIYKVEDGLLYLLQEN
jgi:carbonic anhydrase